MYATKDANNTMQLHVSKPWIKHVEIEILKDWFPFKSNFYPWDKLSFQL